MKQVQVQCNFISYLVIIPGKLKPGTEDKIEANLAKSVEFYNSLEHLEGNKYEVQCCCVSDAAGQGSAIVRAFERAIAEEGVR